MKDSNTLLLTTKGVTLKKMLKIFSLSCSVYHHMFLGKVGSSADCVTRCADTFISNSLFEICDTERLGDIHLGFHVSPKEKI